MHLCKNHHTIPSGWNFKIWNLFETFVNLIFEIFSTDNKGQIGTVFLTSFLI